MPADVVGVELGVGVGARGCPAVRLVRRKDGLSVRALGFVLPPNGDMPNVWKDLGNQPTWSLPKFFAASSAALAVDTPHVVVRQTTLESLLDGTDKRIAPGVPVSRNGLRMTVASLGEASFVLESGLPEFQVLWLSRLLPEGRCPTACSVQTVPTAMLAALVEQPEFKDDGGNAAALFVTMRSTYFVGFRSGTPVLFREFPGAGGLQRIHEAIKSGLGVREDRMVADMLDDSLIDPTPILRPIANPILRQLELSLDYLRNRVGVEVGKVFLMGLSSGARHWIKMAEDILNVKMVSPGLFEGVDLAVRLDPDMEQMLKRSHVFMAAFGAARAAMEVGQ